MQESVLKAVVFIPDAVHNWAVYFHRKLAQSARIKRVIQYRSKGKEGKRRKFVVWKSSATKACVDENPPLSSSPILICYIFQERLGHFIPHFVQLLAEWTETFPYDFRDERVMVHVRAITQKFVTVEPGIRKEVSQLLQNLLLRLTTLEKYEEFLQRVAAEATVDSLEALSSVCHKSFFKWQAYFGLLSTFGFRSNLLTFSSKRYCDAYTLWVYIKAWLMLFLLDKGFFFLLEWAIVL